MMEVTQRSWMRGMTIRAATIAKTTRQKASRLRATGEGEEKGKSSPVRIRREGLGPEPHSSTPT